MFSSIRQEPFYFCTFTGHIQGNTTLWFFHYFINKMIKQALSDCSLILRHDIYIIHHNSQASSHPKVGAFKFSLRTSWKYFSYSFSCRMHHFYSCFNSLSIFKRASLLNSNIKSNWKCIKRFDNLLRKHTRFRAIFDHNYQIKHNV